MKCDKCGGEATVHEVTIRSGKKVERHLCEQCAKGEGLPVQPQNVSVTQVLHQFIAQQAAGAAAPLAGPSPEAAKASQCPVCGTTYAQFRHDGLLGCPECYASFEIQLGPLLERAHEGGTHHVGKVPRRIAGPAQPAALPAPPSPGAPHRSQRPSPPKPAPRPAPEDRARRAESLKRKLAEAVASEQSEGAATLRDELRRLDEPNPTPGREPGPSAPGSEGSGDGGGSGGGGGGA